MIFHSSFEYSYLWLPLVGFIIGLLASMIGGGGGFFFPPILIILFGIPAQIAVATSLAATLPICIVGSFGHYRNGNIDIRMGLVFGSAGILGAILGASLTGLMTAEQLKTTFGLYSILLAFIMIFNNYRDRKNAGKGKVIPNGFTFRRISRGSFYGFVAGVITGTFGTSGTAPVLAGMFALRMPIKVIVGTSLMVIFINTFSALGAHFLVGEIDLTLVYFLAGGAVIGAFSGPKLLAGVKFDKSEGPIKQWYAFAMIAFGIIMIMS
jgi:uncharacterized protein